MDMGRAAPPFSLRQLQYLVAIEEQGGFSKAAEHCRVSQPSLSAQVAQLEAALGLQIFERSRRGVVVTTAGEGLLAHARAVLRASQELLHAAEAARDPWSASWRFGIIPTLAAYLLPKLAPSLNRAHPGLRVLWREATTSELVEATLAGGLEASVVALEADLKSLEVRSLGRDPFRLAVAASHPLAGSPHPIALEALEDEHLLLLEDGHCLRDQALEVCRRPRGSSDGYEATSLPTLVEMVAVGEGVTLLPLVATAAVSRDPRVALLDFEPPVPARTIGLAWRPTSALGPQLEEVAALFRSGLGLHTSCL